MGTIRPAYYTDELKVGMTAFQSKTITETDIILFRPSRRTPTPFIWMRNTLKPRVSAPASFRAS